jgi:hypothetical protein
MQIVPQQCLEDESVKSLASARLGQRNADVLANLEVRRLIDQMPLSRNNMATNKESDV